MPVIEFSSMCLNEENYLDKINKAKDLVRSNGFEFGVQIHNSIERSLYDKLLELKDDVKFSVHSPVFSEYFFNLANEDFEFYRPLFEKNASYLKEAGTDIFFFHGFFMTDRHINHDMKNYRATIREGIGDQSSLNGSFIMNPSFFDNDIFQYYKKNFVANRDKLMKMFPDLTVTFENDFVGIGSGMQRPREIIELIDNLWFDLGHFWCSSMLHGFDYYEKCDEIIGKKKILGVHINHNFTKKSTEKEKIRDSHAHLYEPSDQDLKPVLRKLLDKGNGIFTLEIVGGDVEDVKVLLDWLT